MNCQLCFYILLPWSAFFGNELKCECDSYLFIRLKCHVIVNHPHNFSGWYFLELFIGHTTKQSIQNSIVEICNFDLAIIPSSRGVTWFLSTNFKSQPYFFIKSLKKKLLYKLFSTHSTIKQRRNQKRLSTIHDNGS